MICDPCKHAGKQLSLGNVKAAIKNHELCQEVQADAGLTWCDCHHKTTSCLNLQRIKQATMDDKDESPRTE